MVFKKFSFDPEISLRRIYLKEIMEYSHMVHTRMFTTKLFHIEKILKTFYISMNHWWIWMNQGSQIRLESIDYLLKKSRPLSWMTLGVYLHTHTYITRKKETHSSCVTWYHYVVIEHLALILFYFIGFPSAFFFFKVNICSFIGGGAWGKLFQLLLW